MILGAFHSTAKSATAAITSPCGFTTKTPISPASSITPIICATWSAAERITSGLIGADHRALFEATEKEAPGFAFVVYSMNLTFLKPARMDDVLDVVTDPHEVKGASVTLRQRVTRGDELLVEANVRVAFISEGRARPIPKPLRIAMKADQDAAGA